MSSVSLEAAIGTITLHLMLLFSPSAAQVLVRPTRPSLAELKIGQQVVIHSKNLYAIF